MSQTAERRRATNYFPTPPRRRSHPHEDRHEQRVSDEDLDLIFRKARTHNVWLDKPVEDALLRQVLRPGEDGADLGEHVPDAHRLREVAGGEGTAETGPRCGQRGQDDEAAPVTAIIGMDIHFYEQLPKLFPHADAKAWFKDLPENVLEYIALRNSSLQGAYFMLAARSLGLDCGPMSGFNNAKVDAAFFAGTTVKSNFLCNLGSRRREQALSALAAPQL